MILFESLFCFRSRKSGEPLSSLWSTYCPWFDNGRSGHLHTVASSWVLDDLKRRINSRNSMSIFQIHARLQQKVFTNSTIITVEAFEVVGVEMRKVIRKILQKSLPFSFHSFISLNAVVVEGSDCLIVRVGG